MKKVLIICFTLSLLSSCGDNKQGNSSSPSGGAYAEQEMAQEAKEEAEQKSGIFTYKWNGKEFTGENSFTTAPNLWGIMCTVQEAQQVLMLNFTTEETARQERTFLIRSNPLPSNKEENLAASGQMEFMLPGSGDIKGKQYATVSKEGDKYVLTIPRAEFENGTVTDLRVEF